jgi:hypothetical protein
MGKKSRLKREKRVAATGASRSTARAIMSQPRDASFQAITSALRSMFTAYHATDVVVSLTASELWLPNRSSLVKHTLAKMVLLSIPIEEFRGLKSIATFKEFSEFLEALKPLLPQLPMLEDFVPEPDWGEIRVFGATGFEPIFYGGSVERIPDFIEAFRLLAAEHPQALADMNLAIGLQRYLIESISQGVVGGADLVRPGHMEIPSIDFWGLCRQTLVSIGDSVRHLMPETSDWIVATLGALRVPDSMNAFGEMVMSETALPMLFVRVSGQILPVAPRSATSTVLDLWSKRIEASGSKELLAVGRGIGVYVSKRFRTSDVIAGPIHLVSDSARFDLSIAAALRSGNKFHFILPIDAVRAQSLGKIERQLKALVDGSKRWGLALEDTRQIIELRNKNGDLMRSENIRVVAVLARASTQPSVILLPKSDAHFMGLPDFVSLFDSLEDGTELERFWAYRDNTSSITGGFAGLVDHFAAFRDSHALLVDGALTPDFISIDPHWNSSWRFNELERFWSKAPSRFPDGLCTWDVEPAESGITCLKAKGLPVLAWSGVIGVCTIQATMEVNEADIDFDNGPLLELFVHCVIDSLTQRSSILTGLTHFQRPHFILKCDLNPRLLPARDDEDETNRRALEPLLNAWELIGVDNATKLEVAVQVNTARLSSRLNDATNNSFEAECATAVVVGLHDLSKIPLDENVLTLLNNTGSGRPRFTLHVTQRMTDVPDHASPELPKPEQFKLARKELAMIFKEHGISAPARYELVQAKLIMNSARDAMRLHLHERIASYDRTQLLQVCVQQHDELTSSYQREVTRLRLSLSHEVSFDRSSHLAEFHEKYTQMARNYRYLLECCLSLQGQGINRPEIEDVIKLIASIDWLSVLYGASDTLHNGIDVGGLELDNSFVPIVFFSDDRDAKEQQYLRGVADAKLGIGLLEDDEVNSENDSERNRERLNAALIIDIGFSVTQLIRVLEVLSRWRTVGGVEELHFRYSASPTIIAEKVLKAFPDAPVDQITAAIAFLTLAPSGIRQLSRKDALEPDVPVWEHFKRVHRYLIRPLVPLSENQLTWGAATAARTRSIWLGSFSNGYLPADFSWPNVSRVVRDIKKGIEDQLEVRAGQICLRHTAHAIQGIDFRNRFPQEQFDDVGDFDVLAYWPDRNLWLAVECKYNQPPYCLKDARRLRERVFGDGNDHAQFAKIDRRLQFLTVQCDRLRSLLDWPLHATNAPLAIRAAYVSRDIYWVFLHPPYPVAAKFVRIDSLDDWLRTLLAEVSIATSKN